VQAFAKQGMKRPRRQRKTPPQVGPEAGLLTGGSRTRAMSWTEPSVETKMTRRRDKPAGRTHQRPLTVTRQGAVRAHPGHAPSC
jgi:hypothetical protein